MRRLILLLTFALLPLFLHAQDDDDRAAATRAHYTKSEVRITMRDGVRLFTSIYAPKDTNRSYPILLERTPYSVSPYGATNYRSTAGPAEIFDKEGFIFVYQDVRGRYESEGNFVDNPIAKNSLNGPKDTDETTDTYDTIDWLIHNVPNNNGRAGQMGISYPGMFAAFGLIRSHPALKAVSPQAPMGDVGNGDDAYHNGAFFLAANFGFYIGFSPRGPTPTHADDGPDFSYGTPDQYDFYLRLGSIANTDRLMPGGHNVYWTDTLDHPNYDSFWSSRALAPHMNHIHPAVLFVGGWFDAEDLAGPLKLFRAAQKDGSAPALSLVMGPWRHGGWAGGTGESLGNLHFHTNTAEFFREHIELPFFLQYLKDGPKTNIPRAWLFETGTNQWRRFDSWPPKHAHRRSLYLTPSGDVSFSAPRDGESFNEYTSDPAKPVPLSSEIGDGFPGDYMTRDQRFAAQRPDVLVYESAPLDHDVTIAGSITPSLRVSTSGTDADFDIKLIDVYPNDTPDPEPNPRHPHLGGYQQLVRGEPFRGKFRHSMSDPEPFVPNQPDTIKFDMPDVLHTFRKGHRIMVQIQSTWFPLVDLNPQTFVNIPTAKPSDFQKATQRIYCGGHNPSRLDVLVLE